MKFEIKVCVDGMEKPEDAPESTDMPEMPEEPPMDFETASKRFKELLGMGTARSMGLTIEQRQEELKKVLAFLSGEEPEDD